MTLPALSSHRTLTLSAAAVLGVVMLTGVTVFAHGSTHEPVTLAAPLSAPLPALGATVAMAAPMQPEDIPPLRKSATPSTGQPLAPMGFRPAQDAASDTPPAGFQPAIQSAVDRSAPAFTQETLVKLPVNARHMLVVDDTGHVLMAKDADAVVPIASLTKLMTAMVVLDAHQDASEELRIEAEDVDLLKHSASRVAVGTRLTRVAALEMALMASENRAASALARHYPGGLPAFESAMHAKIRALGLTHTTLDDPTGLSPANLSTASEVARIAMAASHYPEITRITSGKSARVTVNGRMRELHNTNHLVGGKGWDIHLSKTGFTNEAGRCLAMRMKSGSQTLTIVLLDTDGSAQRLRDASLIRRSLTGEPREREVREVRQVRDGQHHGRHKVKLS